MKSKYFKNCDKCSEGYKKAIEAGARGKPKRFMNLITLLCKDDEPGTKYDRFNYVSVPCDCEQGKALNDAGTQYPLPVAKALAANSFRTQGEAYDFLCSKGLQ